MKWDRVEGGENSGEGMRVAGEGGGWEWGWGKGRIRAGEEGERHTKRNGWKN